jgi:KaiC/GvpD/RAD55 family RecA-like ATPase
MKTLPYSDIFVDLLTQIHQGLGYCHSKYKSGEKIDESDEYLYSLFLLFEKKYRASGLNKHLTKGLNKTIQERHNVFPRLSKLIIHSYLQAQEAKNKSHYKAEIIPSPLGILYRALTVPEEPQTASYAFVLCRGMLFYFLGLHPEHPDLKKITPSFDPFNEEDIFKSISSFNSHIDVQMRWPDPRANQNLLSSRINYLNGHILSIKGITYLWFNNDKHLLNFCNKFKKDNLEVLKLSYSNNFNTSEKYSFRLTDEYTALPDSSEVINWIFGIPIPLRGADVLFSGGIKKTYNAGLVLSIHGQPGTGKTSAALSLAAVLAPFHTQTVYVSLEEDIEDLKIRLRTLIPDYLKWLSIFENNFYNERKKPALYSDFNWFTGFKIKNNLDITQLTDFLKLLKEDLYRNTETHKVKEIIHNSIYLPSTSPLLLVIDNVNELFTNSISTTKFEDLEIFISQCRDMGAIVVLISADDIPEKFKLDYLVDISIKLTQEGLDNRSFKPVRILQLIKTRHQISRQGSHIFHLSNSKGFRISPQVPSQMDRREKLKIQLPSRTSFIHTLNLISSETKYTFNDFLNIALHSQILIHGYGSSGKAGLGMKLLLTPPFMEIRRGRPLALNNKIDQNKNSVKTNLKYINKVLIVSLLYPVEYYEELHRRLIKQFERNINDFNNRQSVVKVIAFYPGYLTAEDFVYKIVRLLEEAKLNGEPFTGIMLDGLHNVFLQFKNLQEAHMIWPLLYSILSRYHLTVVSTFTNFSLNERHIGNKSEAFQTPDDFMLIQQGQKPFLHGLVKAADYYLLLEEVVDDKNNYQKEYWLSVKSSIRTVPPVDFLKWNREELVFTKVVRAEKFYTNETTK